MMNAPEKQANLAMVKEHLSAYVTKAEAGESTVVCRRNQPVARIVPVEQTPSENRTRLGSARGSVVVNCDLTEPAISTDDWGTLG